MIPNNTKTLWRQRRKDEYLFSYFRNGWYRVRGNLKNNEAKNREKIMNRESNRTVSSLNEKKKRFISVEADERMWVDAYVT